MIKKLLIVLLVFGAVIVSLVFVYRYSLIQYSAETIIRGNLPDFMMIDKIDFDFAEKKASFKGLRIVNPDGFTYKYLLEVEEIICGYKPLGKTILDGIEIVDPVIKKPVLSIERLGDGRINLVEMQEAIASKEKISAIPAKEKDERPGKDAKSAAARKPSEMIKLPQDFELRGGKIILMDRFVQRAKGMLFDNINGQVSLKLDDMYSRVLRLESQGQAEFNGDKSQTVKWAITLDPGTPMLTMSNRFEVSGVDITTFEAYYDKYSPFVFRKGKFSGTLIFDFDNGSIGSSNEVHISDFLFYIKRGYESEQFWQTSVQALAKYLTSRSGEVVFDFKIKGDPKNPKFYLGPISKEAVTSMAVDKVSSVIADLTGARGTDVSSGKKTDLDKAKEYIDMFKELMKK